MNSRKAAKSVPSTINRLLKSQTFLKRPPPAFYPTLAHPPPPSLIRSLPSRDPGDLPPTSALQPTPYQLARDRLNAGYVLTDVEKLALENPVDPSKVSARRKMPRPPNSRNAKPLPIVFPEDQIRLQFFRDHPFEAYRPVELAEGESIQEEREPRGKDWTRLEQRTRYPVAEEYVVLFFFDENTFPPSAHSLILHTLSPRFHLLLLTPPLRKNSPTAHLSQPNSAISFALHLHKIHNLPLSTSYTSSIDQFRTLRSEHELALLSAQREAEAHGAVFFTEIERGVRMENKVLDEWKGAREIQMDFLAGRGAGGPGVGGAFGRADLAGTDDAKTMVVDLGGSSGEVEVEFTAGRAYEDRMRRRAELLAERERVGIEEEVEDEKEVELK
ncbi:hypothetical protein T439DRAFT_321257, partial [Meredithblackwellia eburnea MCA 4105]